VSMKGATKWTTHLTTGLAVAVNQQPGTVIARTGRDVTVRVGGELLHVDCLEVVLDHESACSYCDGTGQRATGNVGATKPAHLECEDCSGAGVMACTYCGELADAGQPGGEWCCEDCAESISPACDAAPYLGPAADPDGINSWRGGL
jgi:hypothetical protein